MTATDPAYGLEVLAFGPHPDDVELFCGGLLARMADLGHRTGIVDLTRGEKSSRGTPETRAAETEAASRVLGLTVRENLGLPDGWINPWAGFEAPEAERARTAPVARVVEVLRRLRPELVLVPWQQERHPDHEATSALVTRALFFASVRKFETEPPSAPFTPRQVLYYGPQTLVGSPLSLTSLEARDRFYGARIGVSHGEPYVLRETLGLSDPLDHFRRNTFARPLFFPEPR
jgi:bacillithiol biosynthesis deacetylase BshB1